MTYDHRTGTAMTRTDLVLAALAAVPDGSFSPVQVQKLFFLIDENISDAIGGKKFDFVPYDYGPFDPEVYRTLNHLQRPGLTRVEQTSGQGGRRYELTPRGFQQGTTALETLPPNIAQYLRDLGKWVISQSFSDLVTTIYRMYPGMKVNSVFNK